MHTLSPETDNCPSWISGRERMTVENISWSTSTKECCRPRRGLNPRPPGLQSDGASNWATEAGVFLIYKSRQCFSTRFGVNWLLGSGGETKNRFSRWLPWRPSWISDRHDFSYFDLQVTPMLPSKFGVNWPFGSGKEAKNRFSRWLPLQPCWISNRHDFSYFWSYPNAS